MLIFAKIFCSFCNKITLEPWTLKMGPIVRRETSVNNYQHTLCNNSEERRSHLQRDERRCIGYVNFSSVLQHSFRKPRTFLIKKWHCYIFDSGAQSLAYNDVRLIMVADQSLCWRKNSGRKIHLWKTWCFRQITICSANFVAP